MFPLVFHLQIDASAVGCVLGRVVEEIGEDLREPYRVAVDRERLGRQIEPELMMRRLDEAAAGLDRAPQHDRDLDSLLAELDFATSDAGHLEEVVDEPHHVVDLALHELAHPLRVRMVACCEPQDVQRIADRSERIAQLVREDRQELVLAAVGLLERLLGALAIGDVALDAQQVLARLVLSPAGPQGRADRADQGRHAKRALEDGEVSHPIHRGRDGGGVRSRSRQHQHGEVGPRRLTRQPADQALRLALPDRLLGQQDGPSAGLDLADQLFGARAGLHRDAGLLEHLTSHDAVAARRGQEQHAKVEIRAVQEDFPPALFSTIGTPVRIPRKWRSGGPRWIPPCSMKHSRMVRS